MTEIHDLNNTLVNPRTPQTHALIIGVGQYDHLPGSGKTQATINFNLKQITSPPISARHFARWLVDKYNPHQKLGSVQLLLSEANPQPFEVKDGTGAIQQLPIKSASMDEIETAFNKWYNLLSENSVSIGIFYFAGHGVNVHGDHVLFASDYGKDNRKPLFWAFSIDRTINYLKGVDNKLKCFFIDSCNNKHPDTDSFPYPPTIRSFGDSTTIKRPNHTILKAAATNSQAYGMPNKTSIFTTALINALNGNAGTNDGPVWVVRVQTLKPTLENSMERWENLDNNIQLSPESTSEGSTDEVIHQLPGRPILHVNIETDPETAISEANLAMKHTDTAKPNLHWERIPTPRTWQVEVGEPGEYAINMNFIRESLYADIHAQSFYIYPINGLKHTFPIRKRP